MLTLIAMLAYEGPPCHGFIPTVCATRQATPIYAAPYSAPYVAPTYVAPAYTDFHFVDRASFAVFQVGNGQTELMLSTLNQQARTLDLALRDTQARLLAAEQQRFTQGPILASPQIQQQQPAPAIRQPVPQAGALPQQQPPPAPQRTIVGPDRQPGAVVLVERCTKCHGGAMGEKNGWSLNAAELANPSWQLRIRLGNAIFRKDNPMPQGGALTEPEVQSVRAWLSFTPQELEPATRVAQSPGG